MAQNSAVPSAIIFLASPLLAAVIAPSLRPVRAAVLPRTAMAKSSAAIHTPRPSALRSSTSSCPSTRSTVGSTSSSSTAAAAASKLPASNAKAVAKCLTYDDDYFTLPSAAATPAPHPKAVTEDDLAPFLDLPDPDVVSNDTSSVSAAADDDALAASTESCVTEVEVPACADSATDTDPAATALPEEISLALAELRGAGGLSPRSKRLLTALAEAAALELAPAAATANTARRLRLRRAGFWGRVRVAVLAATLAAVVTADVVLAAYLYARRASERFGHAMPPPT